jgi:hypothetical protein
MSTDVDLSGMTRPGFQVADLDAFHQRMIQHQVRSLEKPKSVFGARLARYADPDGLTISVGEARKS